MIDLIYARILYDIVALYSYNQTLSWLNVYFDRIGVLLFYPETFDTQRCFDNP